MKAVAFVSLEDVELLARELHRDMWDRQFTLWPGERVTPLDVCDPERACLMLGYEYREGLVDDRGSMAGQYRLGGFIDRSRRLIAVSDQLNPEAKLFTAAHELGHLQMHPGLHHHRELPIAGITEPRTPVDPIERQANQFAGCFLVPRKQLKLAFRACFGVDSLQMTDSVAYELAKDEFPQLLNGAPGSLLYERAVARAVRFRGKHFESLARTFRVSPTTMAIRLVEVGLVRA